MHKPYMPYPLTNEAPPNAILAALPPLQYQRLQPFLKAVRVQQGDVLWNEKELPAYVYFPACGMISLMLADQNAHAAEVGVVGAEGIVGGDAFGPNQRRWYGATVTASGVVLRLPVEEFREQMRSNPKFQELVLGHLQNLHFQAATYALCNHVHSVEERLSTRLLLTQELLHADELFLTHEMMATRLGVRRSGVTIAAGALNLAGCIDVRRCRIKIVDRAELKRRACPCYGPLYHQFQQLHRNAALI